MMCASSSVPKPFLTVRTLKNTRSEMAVTISGFITGRSLMRSTIFCTTLRDFERPMAVIVPTTVETTVAALGVMALTEAASA